LNTLRNLYHDQLSLCRSNPANAALLAGIKPEQGGDVIETAAMVGLARVIMNLDEFVTRE
jgi:hypothetical protein